MGWRALVESELSWTLFFQNVGILVDIFVGCVLVEIFHEFL